MFKIMLPGMGGPKVPDAPPPPPPPARPPRQAQAQYDVTQRGPVANKARGVGGAVRNEGGGAGLSLSTAMRALKALTGQ